MSHSAIGVPNLLSKLIFIGRLTEQKRPNWVLDIGCSLNIPSIFIGEGNMLTDLMVRSSEENIDATFMGYLTDPWTEISSGCLLIVPSEYEGDGLVILEALQRNVPLVLADIPEFRRFALPDLNYCQDINAFISTVDIQRNNISNFIVNPETIRETILSRTPNSVGDSWDLFLNKL
jgi:glycosyltransferase involved in cell wall biosynthesis